MVNGTLFGAVAVYGCLAGFGPGSTGIRCQQDGSWGPLNLTCDPNGCPLPDDIDHGSFSLSDGMNSQSIASYACDPPYVLDGNVTRVCDATGEWSDESPACRLEGSCTPDPCSGGTCVEYGQDLMECECQTGFTGPYCSTDINECDGGIGPCFFIGASSCINFIGGYFCNCRTGWSGENCDVQEP
ncbi:MAG: hypothetical protein WBG86_13645 [Polyangiales bacterium]